MYFHVYLIYRFTRTFTDHSSVITRCWGFELQNGKSSLKSPQTLATQDFAPASFLSTPDKKHRKLRFSMLFCCENAEKGVGQNVGQALTHTVTHKRNKLYQRKWTRDFDPWSRSADTHLTHRGSQRLCRLLPAHAPWVQRNARKEPKSTGEEIASFPVLCLPAGLIESAP